MSTQIRVTDPTCFKSSKLLCVFNSPTVETSRVLTTKVWFVQCFARQFVKSQQNLYTTGVITTIIKRRKCFKTGIGNFEEFLDIFLTTLNEHAALKKK